MKKLFTLLLALVATTALWAYDFQSGDLYYRITSNSAPYTVEVRVAEKSIVTATIPSTVTNNGTTYSVTSIGYRAFYDCSGLTSITIPNSVTSIGAYAFQNCSGLTSITIGNSVTTIGLSAFYNCSSLTSITIPNSVTSIGSSAFYNCSSLTKTNYTGNIADWCNIKFNYYANPMSYSHNFYINDQEIKDLVISNSVDTINDYAFYGCSSLTSVTIPNSVISLGSHAFYGCSGLTSVTIGNSVTSIGDRAFDGCSSLTSMTIGNSVTSIGYAAFHGCSSLTKTNYTGDIADWCNIKFDDLANPMIYSRDFYINDQEIKDLVIPNSVDTINNYAFSGCSFLTSVTIPNSVISIGDWAFSGCSSLTKTNYTGDIAGWCNIKFGNFSANPMSYSHNFYINDQEIKDLVIPNGVDTINNYAFYECSSLTSVTIPNSVTSIGGYAFRDCSSLTSVTIGNSVISIGGWAFWRCSGLTSVTIPNSVTSIGNQAFSGCSHLTSITIPNSVTSIGNLAFSNCSSLTSMVVESGNTTYDSRDKCNAIIETATNTLITGCRNTTIPNSVTTIGEEAFYDCYNIGSIVIPNSVTSIGKRAFFNSTLRFLTIGNSVTNIGDDAFYVREFFLTIISKATTPPILGNNVFADDDETTVYVPCGSVDSYKAAEGWSVFTNIQEPLSEYSLTVDTQNSVMGSAKVEKNSACEAALISATANEGYLFKQWSDGNTDNPRTLVLTQDTMLTAIFAAQTPILVDYYEEACDSYTWNGQVYTESGEYTYRTTASNGCDSIVTLHLTINTAKTFEETIVTCDSYTWNGQVYTESGEYTYRTTASNGCDSIVTLHLTINKSAVAEMEYATICNGETYTWNGAVYKQAGDYSVTLNTATGCDSIVSLKLTILPAMQTETQNLELCTSDLPYSWYGQTLTEAGTYTYIEQYAGYTCDSVEHVLNLQVHTLVLPSSVSLPVAVCGSSIDVSAATADIEAFIASEPTYAANATVTWQQQQAGVWTALSTQPLDGDQGEVIVRYMIISDCGVLESPEIVVPVEMPTPENSKDLDGVKSVSKYNNRIFLFHLNDFVKKYGWTPQPEQVIWYKVVGDMDAYGAPSNDMVVGIGHSYNLPDGSVIKGDYYALIIQDRPNSNGCTSVYRTVVLTATQDENNSPALVPNVVQPNAQLSLQNLDPTKVHEVRVYDTSGDCIATYMADHVSEFLFNANHVAGYYLVDVINENNKITLRYVVK